MVVHIVISWLFVIISHFVVETSVTSLCDHVSVKKHELFTGVRLDITSIDSLPKRPPYSNLRIHLEFTESFRSYHNSEQIKREVILQAKYKMESIIRVKNPNNGILRVNRYCKNGLTTIDFLGEVVCFESCEEKTLCVNTEIPDKFLKKCKYVSSNRKLGQSGKDGDGLIGIDIALIVEVRSCQGSRVAAAASCYMEKELDRPILGVLILCDGRIVAGQDIVTRIATIQHEIIHALGFSVDKYAFYRYGNGSPIVSRDNFNLPNLGFDDTMGAFKWNDVITKNVQRSRSSVYASYKKSVTVMTLPTVLEVARKYFNCSLLDGVDMEEYPKLSHFDEYILYNEMMTPEVNGPITRLSKITLALLNDTGWYGVNLDDGKDFHHGENKGCGIIFDGCYKYMNDQKAKGLPLHPFCDKVTYFGNIYSCNSRREWFHYCILKQQKFLPQKYQYFDHLDNVPDSLVRFYGGPSHRLEYCPVLSLKKWPDSFCSDSNNDPEQNDDNILNSYYGTDSACFENGLWNDQSRVFYGASCQKFNFNILTKKLIIYFATRTIVCPSNNIFLLPAKYGEKATFICPNIEDFEISISNRTIMNQSPRRIMFMEIKIISFILTIRGMNICLF